MDNNVNEISRLASSSFQSGNFYSQQDYRIDGVLEGVVCTAGRVVIGQGAYVKGEIVCTSLDVWGEVHGDIFVKDVATLKSSAIVEGNLSFDRLQVEIGAQLLGTCARIDPDSFESRMQSHAPKDPRVAAKEEKQTD